MPKNWKQLAAALNLDILDEDLERLQSSLEAMELAVRRLVERLPHDTEPAVFFQCQPVEDS
jgi:hypothetical protein